MNNYYLRVKFGDVDVPLNIGNLRELTIIQDINKFLPEFRLKLVDASGFFTHLLPSDQLKNKVFVEFSQDSRGTDANSFTFDTYCREPEGTQATPASTYDASGLMSIEKLFGPDYSRAFSGSIKSTIESIATELKVNSTSVSKTLNYVKTLIQPYWSNIQFLKYLKERVIGITNEYGYKCYIQSVKGKSTFVFRSLTELMSDQIAFKFSLGDRLYEDRYPIYSYFIYDNFKLYNTFANKKQDYGYFNYTTGNFVESSEGIGNYLSMTDYFLVENGEAAESNSMVKLGRSNDFTSDFKGQVKANYGNRLNSLVKMWITTQGIQNIYPGATVELFFPQGDAGTNLYSYQFSGYWLIETVVHNMGDQFLTKLLLTRNGVDTDKNTTLVKAESSIKKRA